MKPTKLTYFLLFFFITAGGIFIFSEASGLEQSKIEPSNEKKEKAAYPGVEIISKIEDESYFHTAVHYPSFKDADLDKEIESYVQRVKSEFRESVDLTGQKHFKNNPAYLSLTFDVHKVDDEVYSFVFSEESYTGGANGNQIAKVFMVNLRDSEFIKGNQVLKDNEKTRDFLYSYLKNAFETTEDYSPYFFQEELRSWVYEPENTFDQVYLREDSLVFKFSEYEVTAGVAGMPEIVIPLGEAGRVLNEKWKKKLALKEKTKAEDENAENEDQEIQEVQPEENNEASENKKQVALTFDDGPHPRYTQMVLDILKKHNAKATFYVLGSRVDFYPDLVKQIAEQGNEVGNHSWSHKDLTRLSPEFIREEIQQTNEAIEKAAGTAPNTVRPPYGAQNETVKEVIGLPSILWTVDTLDWKTKNAGDILKQVKENTRDGSIILMHDIHQSTANSLDQVLTFLEQEGYELVTVSELKGL